MRSKRLRTADKKRRKAVHQTTLKRSRTATRRRKVRRAKKARQVKA